MLDTSKFHGRLSDLDTHIQPSPQTYEIAAGEIGRQFAQSLREMLESLPGDEAARIGSLTDGETNQFNDETVWNLKGSIAPGAFTPEGRIKAFDQMGVHRGLILSDPGVMAVSFMVGDLALNTMRHWNRFIGEYIKVDRDRLRGVAVLNTHDINVAVAEAEAMLALGVRAFVVSSAVPPGNASPAHPAMDRLWALFQEADAAALLHVGGEMGFMASNTWAEGVDHLNFQPTDMTSESEQINAYMFSSFHYSPQNFLSTIVLGGVFERFPRLRFGAIELGGGWLGPMAERLDQVAHIYRRRMSSTLSMKPSEYIQRNVRVTPYRFEPVAAYIDRYGLADCYCFSSDFPHPEGGRAPIGEFADKIGHLGDDFAERFFVSNGHWLLPSLS